MAHPPTRSSRQRGVTLVEQIIVLAIVAVLSAVAVPPLTQLMSRNRLRVAQMDFIAAMQHARETAVMTGKNTLLCPSADGSSCLADSRWDAGWLLGHDTNRDSQPDGSKALYVGQGYGGRLSIRSSAGRRLVRFLPDGSAGGTNLTLLLCQPGSKEPALSVVVGNSGRVRAATATPAQTAALCDTH